MAAKARKKTTKKIPLLGRSTAAEFQAIYNFTPTEMRRAERILAKVEAQSAKRKPPAKAPAVVRRRKAS